MTAFFIPPGSTSRNPLPLGHAATFKGGWVFKVGSASIDATAQIVAIPGNSPPPPGARYTMVNLSATYTGAGHSSFDGSFYGHSLSVMGAHNLAYGSCYQRLPSPTFSTYQDVYSGQTITGNVCYQIASNDAASLLLVVRSEVDSALTWFALR